MGIARIATATDPHDTAAATYTVTKPTGTLSGHVMLATVGAISTPTFTPPTGWTLIGLEQGNANIRLARYVKVAGGSEPSSYAWALSGGSFKGYAAITTYSGVDTTNPVDSSASASTGSSGAAATQPLTIGGAACWLSIAAVGRHSFTSARTFSDGDASDSQRFNHGSSSASGFDYVGAVFDSNRDLASGANSRTLTSTGSELSISTFSVALRPAASGSLLARLYQASLSAPNAGATLLARLYQAYLGTSQPGGALRGRLYQAYLEAPRAAGQPGKSGLYVIGADGVPRNVALYVNEDGVII